MRIEELNALGRAPAAGDVLAIDTEGGTAKIDYDALAGAILSKWGANGMVDVSHGGTGATTAEGARLNLGVTDTLMRVIDAKTLTGDVVTFGDGVEGMPLNSLVADIQPVQAGEGEPSPENARPITGWTGATVTRCGKNLFNYVVEPKTVNGIEIAQNSDGTFTLNGTATQRVDVLGAGHPWGGQSPYVGGGEYIVSGTQSSDIQIHVGFERTTLGDTSRDTKVKVTAPNGISWVIYRVEPGTTLDNAVVRPMIRRASEADEAFEPYRGDTCDIAFPAGAGTVYGGTLDVTKGLLTVNRASVDMGTPNWTARPEYHAFTSTDIADMSKKYMDYDTGGYLCDIYGSATLPEILNGEKDDHVSINAYGNIWIMDTSFSGADEFKAAVSGARLVYELAEPVTYRIEPRQITTLAGANNIWADCGDVTVEYGAYLSGLKKYIDDKLAAIVGPETAGA